MGIYICMCGYIGFLKRKMYIMMFVEFKFNFKQNKRFRVNSVEKLYNDWS